MYTYTIYTLYKEYLQRRVNLHYNFTSWYLLGIGTIYLYIFDWRDGTFGSEPAYTPKVVDSMVDTIKYVVKGMFMYLSRY